MSSLAFPALVAIFAGAAVAVWLAGIQLSVTTDVLASRLGLGEALGGLLLLAVATNLPETAITVSAAANHALGIAIGNILGGIAIQTVVIVALDAFGLRGGHPLTYRAASLILMLEGALVIAVLVIAIMGSQLPASLIVWRLAPGDVLIVVVWLVGLWLLGRARNGLPWHQNGAAPDAQVVDRRSSHKRKHHEAEHKGHSTIRTALVFGAAALVTLAGGVLLEESGTRIADHVA